MSAGPASQRYRVRVFVDFWNYVLAMRDTDRHFRTDWSRFGPELARTAVHAFNSGAAHSFQGMAVHGSCNPSADHKLHHWATTVLAGFPGVSVSFVKRHRRHNPPSCPRCHSQVDRCPNCGSDMRGTGTRCSSACIKTI